LAAQQVIDALLAHDAARASQWLERKEIHDYLPYHDRLVRFMADSFGFVLERFGDQGLLRFHLDTAEGQRAGFEKWEKQSAAEFARTSAFLLKQHMGRWPSPTMKKFTIVQTPCGSGGRLRPGAYRERALALRRRPPLTLGRCACRCIAALSGLERGCTMRWFGRALTFDHPARPDGSCTLHVYKRLRTCRPSSTPASRPLALALCAPPA
jgi:hypothetical protein